MYKYIFGQTFVPKFVAPKVIALRIIFNIEGTYSSCKEPSSRSSTKSSLFSDL